MGRRASGRGQGRNPVLTDVEPLDGAGPGTRAVQVPGRNRVSIASGRAPRPRGAPHPGDDD